MKNSKKSSKAALVTGGARRVGREICLTLAQNGYDIALHYNRSSEDAEKLSKQIRKLGRKCKIFSCDFVDHEETPQLIEKVHTVFPQLNVLINSASIFEEETLLDCTLESLERNFSIHLKTPFILSKDFAKICKEGNIVNILETHITRSTDKHFSYLLSKKSLYEFTKAAAVELAPNIRVNGVAPGLILAPEGKGGTQRLDRLSRNIPLKKRGNPQFIADAIVFLLHHPYLTGQVIYVDGGEHLN